MKRRFITLFLSALLVVTPLLGTSASAATVGWNKYAEYQNSNYWYYIYQDGSWAKGWQYIEGNWYYFTPEGEGYITVSGKAYIDQNGNWTNLKESCYNIDGRVYFFDNQGRLLTNTYAVLDGLGFYIDANGHPGV